MRLTFAQRSEDNKLSGREVTSSTPGDLTVPDSPEKALKVLTIFDDASTPKLNANQQNLNAKTTNPLPLLSTHTLITLLFFQGIKQ